MDDAAFLAALSPSVEALLERHLSTAKEWFPHELVPWSRGRDFEPGVAWQASECGFELPPAVRSALFVNLLTEDNLPYYFATIDRVFGDGPWGEWARRWTAEEMRHATVMRDYLLVSRAIDPVALERGRMVQVAGGQVPEPASAVDGVVYVTLQELATRISHRNTGKLIPDRAGYDVMARVAADENLHYLFYRDVTSAAIALDPSAMVCAIERQVRGFTMPGFGIPGFDAHSRAIAEAGIYDFVAHHEAILVPVVLRHWRIEELTGLSAEAEAARHRVLKHIGRVGVAARRLRERRAELVDAG